MDLDDLLGTLFEDADLGTSRSRRTTLVARMAFGLIGATLCLAGAYVFLTRADPGGTPVLRVCMAAVFASIAAFCLFNVMLGRSWKWPWLSVAACVIALFATRLAGL
jgi:hypothetical protein